MIVPKISQSLIKAYQNYNTGEECGLFFKARYIDKDPEAFVPMTDVIRLGVYFEYMATGSLPRDGVVPEPDMVYKGKANEKMSADYERATKSAERFKKIIDKYGIIIKKTGVVLDDGECNGILDILAEWDNREVIIDLKYTSLIDDKWSDMGWNVDALSEKNKIMVQGVHYKMLAKNVWGIDDIPFYYFVFSSKDPDNIRIIEQNVDEVTAASHLVSISTLQQNLEYNFRFGFTAYPSIQKCSKCPINHKCEKAVDYPLIDQIVY
jgi:hypothetical protein